MTTRILVRKFVRIGLLLSAAGLIAIADSQFKNLNLVRLRDSFILIAGIYFLFRVLAEAVVRRSIRSRRTRFSIRRALRIIYYATMLLGLITIWVESSESLIVSYGLISAGVALALQDTIKNFLGGLSISLAGLYQIGDRIELENVHGDVIDIDLLYTTVMEIRNWVNGDQPTGRLIHIPNSSVTYKSVFNYTKDHQFIWDELQIPLTYKSNWKKAGDMAIQALGEVNAEITQVAEQSLVRLGAVYYLKEHSLKPSVYFKMTDNWIEMNVRYITDTFKRREIAGELQKKLLEYFSADPKIKVASATIRVYGSDAVD